MAILSPPQQPVSASGDVSAPPLVQQAAPGQPKGFDLGDLKQYLHIVVKRIWLVALCFVISVGTSVFMLMRQVDTYQCSAKILLSSGLPFQRQFKFDEPGELSRVGADYVATQLQILYSKEIKNRARKLSSYSPSVLDENITTVGAHQLWLTSMLSVNVISLDPVVGADYANAMAEAYVEFKAEERLSTSQGTLLGLTQQASRLKKELARAEEKLLKFRKENRVVGIANKGNLAEDTMSELAKRAVKFRLERMTLQYQQPLLRDVSTEVVLKTIADLEPRRTEASPGRSTGGGEGRPDPTETLIERGVVERVSWQTLKRDKAFLESDLQTQRQRFRDSHPKVQETIKKLDEINRKLEIELDFARRQFDAQLESLRIQEEAAQRAEQEWEDEALEVSRKAMVYDNLERDVQRLRRLYDLIFDRLREVDVTASFEPETVRIIEEAVAATYPTNPRKLQSLFLSALIGIGIGLGLVVGLEFIDDSIRYPEEVTRGLGLPFFGIVPAAEWDPDDLSSHLISNLDQKSGLAESYRNIRSSMLFSSGESQLNTIAFVSAVPKEGKTTTALNMAVSLAQAGARVLLVDADMRRGELHKFFGLEGGRGLSDVLVGQAKPEAVVQRTAIANLDLVATGPFPPNPAEIILRPEFESFIDYAKRNYDRVLFDCPPVLAVSESAILASLVDSAMFVVWGGHTSKKIAQTSIQILMERGVNVIGCVLNNLEFGRVGYYYYSGYYYDSYYRDESSGESSKTVI